MNASLSDTAGKLSWRSRAAHHACWLQQLQLCRPVGTHWHPVRLASTTTWRGRAIPLHPDVSFWESARFSLTAEMRREADIRDSGIRCNAERPTWGRKPTGSSWHRSPGLQTLNFLGPGRERTRAVSKRCESLQAVPARMQFAQSLFPSRSRKYDI